MKGAGSGRDGGGFEVCGRGGCWVVAAYVGAGCTLAMLCVRTRAGVWGMYRCDFACAASALEGLGAVGGGAGWWWGGSGGRGRSQCWVVAADVSAGFM